MGLKENFKYYISLLLIFSLLVYVEMNKPKQISWSISYSSNDKIPFGTYILRNEISHAFPNKKIIENDISYYQFLKKKKDFSIFIVTNTFAPSVNDWKSLLEHVSTGHEIFISAQEFSTMVSDSLSIATEFAFQLLKTDTTTLLSFVNPAFSKKEYSDILSLSNYYIHSFDTLRSVVCGKNKNGINFIRMKYKKGHIFIHTDPFAFTNYNLLEKNNYEYAFKALSYLQVKNLVWDEYYKPGNAYKIKTPLVFILSEPSLKYAWYSLLIAIFLYIIFEGKRRQRIIPIIIPPKNTSLEFVETVGQVYYHRGDHKNLVIKKFNFFIEFIRTHYFIYEIDFNEENYEKISGKTGVDKGTVVKIFELYRNLTQEGISTSEAALFKMNTLLEAFYNQCK